MLAGLVVALVLVAPVPAPRPAMPAPPGPALAARAADNAVMAPRASLPPIPRARPEARGVRRAALPAGRRAPASGMLCHDPRLSGHALASFTGSIPGCGIVNPVRVSAVGGIPLSVPIKVDCRTARRFADWLVGIVRPIARETLGSAVASVRLFGSYDCRTRNSQSGARLSEHAFGHAIDFAGVTLADGRRIRVAKDWDRGAAGAFLRRIWRGACGRFTTVIGPEGDSYHRTHLHLDTARRRHAWCQ